MRTHVLKLRSTDAIIANRVIKNMHELFFVLTK